MADIDENSEWLGVSRALLMENAGAWVARTAYQWLGGVAGKKIIIFCGTGNNGGDG
ncbi:MAG: bifunctional ADP-dependent NAD(P)H-hydrate dehydratase/NAD(P)H-hydrate epimerase, partial [Thaumarchaeota archaeon]